MLRSVRSRDRGRDPHACRRKARRAPDAQPGAARTPYRRRPSSASASPPRSGRSKKPRASWAGRMPDGQPAARHHRRYRLQEAARPEGRHARRGLSATCPATPSGRLSMPQVLGDIMRHRTTLVFANNRRLAERTADRLNAQIAAERSEEIEPGSTEALAPGGVMRDKGIFALGVEGPIKAHHGSTSQGVAPRDGRGAQGRQASRARLDRHARARHRHRRGRSGRPAPGAAQRGAGPAARGALRPPRRPDQQGPHLRHAPGGPG